VIAAPLRWGIELLASSWSYQLEGREQVDQLHATRTPILYAVWHSGLLPALWRHRGEPVTLLVSQHEDGGRLVAAARKWGYDAVRGSSTRGGLRALLALTRILQGGRSVALTPDGPRGPARVAKPGAVAAAQQSGATIVPVGIAASVAWRPNSWDRFLVPRPFARVRMVYEKPFTVDSGPSALSDGIEQLQSCLMRATVRAECPA
jgi:lysophospholipid acyltransferase (LPLAT)-like uncharacterized protein